MVAIRNLHNPENIPFQFNRWLEDLDIAPTSAEILTKAWAFSEQKFEASNIEDYNLLQEVGVEMADILRSLNMDENSLLCSILFPVYDNNLTDQLEISEKFNPEVARLLRGLVDLDCIKNLSGTISSDNLQIDKIRQMLLAMVKDFRCVVIKLAERICYLRSLSHCVCEEERVLGAKQCYNIYAPLANRLGIGQLKWELEDYCFAYLHPEKYRKIALLLNERRIDREEYIYDFVNNLTDLLQKNISDAKCYGRPKHIYSIWRKMSKKHLKFEQLFDIRAVRVIVPNIEDCYTALSTIHSNYVHIPSEFDDYVSHPKPNGYQSIHTVVIGVGNKPVEVQIRTQEMHDYAEMGVAAHWKYKEGDGTSRDYEEKITWLRKLLAWQDDLSNQDDINHSMHNQIFNDRVYVFSPKGEIIDLPEGATPLDFAYSIHSEIGHRCIGAKVNGRIVQFTYKLKMGDQVEIITQKNPNPSRDWLNSKLGFVNTSKARSKIMVWFKKLDREKNIPIGKELLENEMLKHGISQKQIENYGLPRYNIKNFEDLYALIGGGDIKLSHLFGYLLQKVNKTTSSLDDDLLRISNKPSNHNNVSQKNEILIEGVGNLMHHVARCCQPIPGDQIAGFITQGRGISIHRQDCEQLHALLRVSPERGIVAKWGDSFNNSMVTSISIVADDRPALLRDITTILANNKINVLGITSRSDVKKQMAFINIQIEFKQVELLGKLLQQLQSLEDIIEAKRITN